MGLYAVHMYGSIWFGKVGILRQICIMQDLEGGGAEIIHLEAHNEPLLPSICPTV